MQGSYSNINKPTTEKLINDNLKSVHKIAWHLYGRVKSIVEIDDLIQIGMMGLVTAANNFKPKPGATFETYANIRIKGEIIDFLRKNSNLCRTTIQKKQLTDKAFDELKVKLQREPNEEEVASHLNMPLLELQGWKEAFAANKLEDLDTVYDEFSIWFTSKENNPEEKVFDKQLRAQLIEALKKLEKKEALVIQLYYVEELNIYEIAEVLDISTGRVSQIKTSAIKNLRKHTTYL